MLNDNIKFIFDEEINSPYVFLIDGEVKHPKISLSEAIAIAKNKKMNVVQIVEGKNGSLPIARVVDKGKYVYDFKKKQKEKVKQHDKTIRTKEIKVKPSIHDNDLARYAKHTIEWAKSNCQVVFKIDLRDDSRRMFSMELRKLGRRLKDEEKEAFKKEMNAKNDVLLEEMAHKVYDRFIILLASKVKVIQPLKKSNALMFTSLFGA